MPPLQFHFDFISPYGFFASLRIEDIAERHARTVDWHPMLLGVSVLKVMGLKSLLATPLKGAYVRRDVHRYARKHGIAITRDLDGPAPNPLAMGRAFCWVKQHHPHAQGEMAHAIYDAHWMRNRELATAQEIAAEVALPAGIGARALVEALAGPEPGARLRASVQASLDAGVFGSPTVVADGEMFWGVERLPDVEEWLARGGW